LALLEEHIVTHQIGSGSDDTLPTLTFYVESMGVRRELVPGVKDGKRGYNCVTITGVGPEPHDRRVKKQTDFDKILVTMNLMEPNAPSMVLAPSWPTGMDKLVRRVNKAVDSVTGSRRKETWLPLLK
jgi:hypothetical protein